jgi:hypothetical protein
MYGKVSKKQKLFSADVFLIHCPSCPVHKEYSVNISGLNHKVTSK